MSILNKNMLNGGLIKNDPEYAFIFEWLLKNEKYIDTMLKFLEVSNARHSDFMFINEKYKKVTNFWTPSQLEEIEELMAQSIQWHKNMFKNVEKNIYEMRKIRESVSRYIMTDKHGTKFILHKNLLKIRRILDMDYLSPEERFMINGLKEYNEKIIKKFDSIYDKCMQSKSTLN